MTTTPNLIIQPDATTLAHYVAEWLTTQAETSTGTFSICLSGGSTPKALYALLATEPFRSRMPWSRLHLFFGDERFVPHTHADSNYHMVQQTLLQHVPIPTENIHAFNTSGTPQTAAAHYEAELKKFYGNNELDPKKPLFNITLLGLGEDGHTASLFPNTQALTEHTAWATSVIGAKPEPRLTLTYKTLENSEIIAFIAAGASKKDMLQRAMAHDTTIPAGNLNPTGQLIWFTDTAAIHN